MPTKLPAGHSEPRRVWRGVSRASAHCCPPSTMLDQHWSHPTFTAQNRGSIPCGRTNKVNVLARSQSRKPPIIDPKSERGLRMPAIFRGRPLEDRKTQSRAAVKRPIATSVSRLSRQPKLCGRCHPHPVLNDPSTTRKVVGSPPRIARRCLQRGGVTARGLHPHRQHQPERPTDRRNRDSQVADSRSSGRTCRSA